MSPKTTPSAASRRPCVPCSGTASDRSVVVVMVSFGKPRHAPAARRRRGNRRKSGRVQPIADAGFGQDVRGSRGIGLQLLPQLTNENAEILHVVLLRRAP